MYYLSSLFYAFTAASLIIGGLACHNLRRSPNFNKLSRALLLVGSAFLLFFLAINIGSIDSNSLLIATGRLLLFAGLSVFILIGVSTKPKTIKYISFGVLTAFFLMFLITRISYPSNPYFSQFGVFYFNSPPILELMGVTLVNFSIIPAAIILSAELKSVKKSHASRSLLLSLTILAIGICVLMVNKNNDLFLFDCYMTSVAEFVLVLTTLDLFR